MEAVVVMGDGKSMTIVIGMVKGFKNKSNASTTVMTHLLKKGANSNLTGLGVTHDIVAAVARVVWEPPHQLLSVQTWTCEGRAEEE